MATPQRPGRPGRPSRPSSASARRAPPPPQDDEYVEGEEEFLDEEPAKPEGPSVVMMVGLGAALLFAILLAMLVFSKRSYLLEVENISEEPIQQVVVKINGAEYEIGDLRPNSIERARPDRSPGNEVSVTYRVPNRGVMTKNLPKKDLEGGEPAPDFTNFKGQFRLRIMADGIHETVVTD
jgi:hypothetical protein